MIEKVDEQVLNARQRLAGRVRDDLAAAGLPVAAELSGDYRVGAVVEVEPGDDAEAGVWVFWKAHPHLSQGAARAVREGRFDDPVVERSGAIEEIMQKAISAVLESAGYGVEDPDEEYRPFNVRVVSAPGEGQAQH